MFRKAAQAGRFHAHRRFVCYCGCRGSGAKHIYRVCRLRLWTSAQPTAWCQPRALENPSYPGDGRSKWRDLVRRRSQLDAGSYRGRLPRCLHLLVCQKLGQRAVHSNRAGSGTMAHGDVCGLLIPGVKVPLVCASLVCPSSAAGSSVLAEQVCYVMCDLRVLSPYIPSPAFFSPHNSFAQAEELCGGKNAAPSLARGVCQLPKTRASSKTSRLRHRW